MGFGGSLVVVVSSSSSELRSKNVNENCCFEKILCAGSGFELNGIERSDEMCEWKERES